MSRWDPELIYFLYMEGFGVGGLPLSVWFWEELVLT